MLVYYIFPEKKYSNCWKKLLVLSGKKLDFSTRPSPTSTRKY